MLLGSKLPIIIPLAAFLPVMFSVIQFLISDNANKEASYCAQLRMAYTFTYKTNLVTDWVKFGDKQPFSFNRATCQKIDLVTNYVKFGDKISQIWWCIKLFSFLIKCSQLYAHTCVVTSKRHWLFVRQVGVETNIPQMGSWPG